MPEPADLQRAIVVLRPDAGGKTKAGDADEALRAAFEARLTSDLARVSAELEIDPPLAIESWSAFVRTVNVTWHGNARPASAVTQAIERISYVLSVTVDHPIDWSRA